YHTKETLGVDRLVNAAAACFLYGIQGKPVIVIDMGTATTIDYVNPQNEFLGGAIAPGLVSASKGLEINAPELPQIDLSSDVSAIGRTTDECIRSGVILGHAAMIKGMVDLMSAQSHETGPIVVLTGGLSEVVKESFSDRYIFDKNLTLKGLYHIYRINRHQTC
ncbi:MAG: type III pantothenate kinase, partial [Deltaproteobacteria bacterium]|nr:type III pantothenate kinase [Deltaproteobacteria bacterium]